MRLIDNPADARRLMEALREMGYDSYASVADLVDNAIDAGAKKIQVRVDARQNDVVIEITDDGCGMTVETLSEALRLGGGAEHDPHHLGKFGMGLITASIGLSRCVEVFTKVKGGKACYGSFDLDVIAEQNRLVKHVDKATAAQVRNCPYSHGTMVRLSKTDRISHRSVTSFVTALRQRLGQTHRKFLAQGLKLWVNGHPVEAVDPLMLHDPETRIIFDGHLLIDGGKVSLVIVDLPDYGPTVNRQLGILPGAAGFYLVRNNREIAAAQTLGFFRHHHQYSHFRAEVAYDGTMDHQFHTDVKKASVQPSHELLQQLKRIALPLLQESGRLNRERSNTGRGEIDHSLAETAIASHATGIPKPKRPVTGVSPVARPRPTPARTQASEERAQRAGVSKVRSSLRTSFEEGNYGGDFFYHVHLNGRDVTIAYNRDHPFYQLLADHADDPKIVAIIDQLVFAMANSELHVPEHAMPTKKVVDETLAALFREDLESPVA